MYRKFVTITLALVCAMFVSTAWGATTGKITGVVTDAQTGEPLIGVTVSVVGTNLGAITDEDGKYTVLNVPDLEEKLVIRSRELGLGAQFGGKYFCLDTRVIRLPRHGASCPVGLGVSCSAHRNIKAKITRDGIFLEKLVADPGVYLPEPTGSDDDAVHNLYMNYWS